MDVPTMIRAICDRDGITQRDLAARLGAHETMVSRWATGTHKPLNFYRRALERMLTDALAPHTSLLPADRADVDGVD
jgi:ribosome-binding protein aMBF1 (putative translation factor)